MLLAIGQTDPKLAMVAWGTSLLALLMAGLFHFGPTSRLTRRLRPVWDGAGLTRIETRGAGEDQRTVRHRPRVFSRKKIDADAFAFRVRPNPGRTVEDIVGCADAIRDALCAREVKVVPIGRGCAEVEVYNREAAPEKFEASEFSAKSSVGKLPIGRDDSGAARELNLGHTLIVGATGSGKGSMLWSYVMSVVAQYGMDGRGAQLWGIDPKRAELAGVDGAFEAVAFDGPEILRSLQNLVRVMQRRQSAGRRSFEHSDDNPVILLVIDEFNALSVMEDRKWQTAVRSSLQQLMSQGRSSGIYVLAAAQQPQKDMLGPYRPHFMNRVCLRVESAQEVDIVLGSGAVELGAKAHMIEPATESNGYATAGIGYVRTDGEPAPVRVRAPFISDNKIESWVLERSKKGAGRDVF